MFELKDCELCNVLLDKATIHAIYMAKMIILWLNRNSAKLNTLCRNCQPPQGMVVPYIKAGKFEEFEIDFQWAARIIVGVAMIPLDCIIE